MQTNLPWATFFASALLLASDGTNIVYAAKAGMSPGGQVYSCVNRLVPPMPDTLNEMIDDSAYIATYGITDVKKTNSFLTLGSLGDLSGGKRVEAYRYEFVRVSTLKGDAPLELELMGLEPLRELDVRFLSLFQRHEWFVEHGPVAAFGGRLVDKGKDGCAFAPQLKTGFAYLIFGGINTPAFEPIFFEHKDALYKAIQLRLKAKKP